MIKRFFSFFSRFLNFFLVLFFVYAIYTLLASLCFVLIHFSSHARDMDRITKFGPVHQYLQSTGWDHVKPCGAFFREEKEFETAKLCSDAALKKELNKSIPSDLVIPRCFVVLKSSPQVSYSPLYKMNAILLRGFVRMFAIVGLYEPSSHTIFLVENYDLTMIYRHELQHYFQHIVEPALIEKNHEGLIWDMCEPRTYTPSHEQKEIIRLQDSML